MSPSIVAMNGVVVSILPGAYTEKVTDQGT